MCGITGFYSFDKSRVISKEQLLLMTEVMSHRGPDDRGCVLFNQCAGSKAAYYKGQDDITPFAEGCTGLGHRRLSILDLSERGRQPMQGADGLVWMVFNGEIYNYLELREELEKLGYPFRTSTDSEVALVSYLEWGTECFARFNGMWAMAFFDRRQDEIILSRDRFGKKPLYFYKDDKVLVFASEIKSILKYPEIRKEINLNKVINYAGRHYRYVDNDNESFFQNINQIPKSNFVIFKRGRTSKSKIYWKLGDGRIELHSKPEGELIEELRDLLRDAVTIRLRSDVPVGCMLSGGMDSTSITCLAAEKNGKFITFSGVTGEGYYDESEYIRAVIEHTGVDSRFIYPQAAALFPTLREMLRYHDEPVCTVTWYCNYIITKQIAEYGVPVVLTGHGGDELLAGYWDHYHYFFSDLRRNGTGDGEELNYWLQNHNRPLAEYEREKEYIQRLQSNLHVEIEKYSQYLDCLSPALVSQAREPLISQPFAGDLSRRLYLELFYEAVPPSLRAEDRNMMAYSIENRVPFLDYRLVEFCFKLDNSLKIRQGLGKWILREAMKGLLPEKVRNRRDKTGFNAPADEWFRQENRQDIEELLDKNSYINREIYNQQELKKRFAEHLAGQNHYMFFWQYINLNLWYELNFA